MIMKRTAAAVVIAAILCLQTACGNFSALQSAGKEKDAAQVDEKTVLAEFDRLTALDNINLKDIASFIESNIKYCSRENASSMIIKLEVLQKESLPLLEKEFYDNAIQGKFQKEQEPNLVEDLKDNGLKTLVGKTRESGYKVETAEGMYYPVLDYTFYETFTPYATEDIKTYVKVMAAESEQPSAKDAALVIGWEEILKRALETEKFLTHYPDSPKKSEMEEVFKRYEMFLLFGTNNTPLFDYTKKEMDSNAKKVLESAIEQGDRASLLITRLQRFMDAAKVDHYRLTEAVENIRKEMAEG